MPDIILAKLAEYGILGIVIAGLGFALYYQHKSFLEERKLWNEERKAWSETNEKYLETSIEVIQANSKALAELSALIQHEFYYPQNRKVSS